MRKLPEHILFQDSNGIEWIIKKEHKYRKHEHHFLLINFIFSVDSPILFNIQESSNKRNSKENISDDNSKNSKPLINYKTLD